MTSTSTSTSTRYATSLTVPSTQNTAPVLDFRCLYTHDLRRKAKRWHDGIVRFHTFNKRVMVYDISRNFIGDTHWRENEFLQDGDDLELDKGVLIQVGEMTGSVDQDLTGLFEKKAKAHLKSPGTPAAAQAYSTTLAKPTPTSPSQLRPKTLNALLGTPKGPLGRASVPLKSPNELRREKENDNLYIQRPPKRQRIEAPIRQGATPAISSKIPPRRIQLVLNGDETTIEGAVQANDLVRKPQSLRLNDDITEPTTKGAKEKTTKRAQVRIDLSDTEPAYEETVDIVRDRPSKPSARSRPHEKVSLGQPRVTLDTSKIRLDNGPTVQLQAATHQPRKKLMCTENPPPKSAGVVAEIARSTKAPPPQLIDGYQKEPHNAKRDRLEARLRRSNKRKKEVSQDTAIDNLNNREAFPQAPTDSIPSSNAIIISGSETAPSPSSQIPLIQTTHPDPKPQSPPSSPKPLPLPQASAKPRSPFRRSFSNPNPLVSKRTALRKTLSNPTTWNGDATACKDQKPDPWSREAWDLFGVEKSCFQERAE